MNKNWLYSDRIWVDIHDAIIGIYIITELCKYFEKIATSFSFFTQELARQCSSIREDCNADCTAVRENHVYPIEDTSPETPRAIVLRGLRAALNLSPIMPRDTSLSRALPQWGWGGGPVMKWVQLIVSKSCLIAPPPSALPPLSVLSSAVALKRLYALYTQAGCTMRPETPPQGMLQVSYWSKPNLGFNYHFTIDLKPIGIPVGDKYLTITVWNCWLN